MIFSLPLCQEKKEIFFWKLIYIKKTKFKLKKPKQ